MARTAHLLIAIACAALAYALEAEAQQHTARKALLEPIERACPSRDKYWEWTLSRPQPSEPAADVPKDAVFELRADQLVAAVGLLKDRDAVALSPDQVQIMVPDIPEDAYDHGKPFLVRNVVPDVKVLLSGPASIKSSGDVLLITVGLFGCGGFYKNPIVVFLPSAPSIVQIQAHAIW